MLTTITLHRSKKLEKKPWKIVCSRYLEFVRKVTFSIWKDEPQESSFITPVGRRYRSALCIVVNTFHVPLFSLEAIMKSKIHLTCRQLLRKPQKISVSIFNSFRSSGAGQLRIQSAVALLYSLSSAHNSTKQGRQQLNQNKNSRVNFPRKTSQKRKRGVNGFQWQP